jgi:hypothetical protein
MNATRLVVLPVADANRWRWELAQLELGHRREWPRPGAIDWARRTRRLGEQLRGLPGDAVLAFDGYALVGAVWPRADWPVLPRGPYVMPQFRDGTLERRLLAAWLRAIGKPDVRGSAMCAPARQAVR